MAFSIISRTASRSFICCSRDIGGRLGLLRLVGFVGFDAASLLPRNHQDGNHELHRAIAAGLERLVEEVKPLIRLPKTIPCPSPDDWALEELSLVLRYRAAVAMLLSLSTARAQAAAKEAKAKARPCR